MIISLNWLKKYVDIDMSIEELTTLIGARLVEIENVIDMGSKYKDALVVKVVEASPMVDSDHLSVVIIDDGGVTSEIERDDGGYIQVVCGAPNISTGQTVVWLPPKSVVPNTFDSNEPFVLDSRKLRGVMSNGMIASARELDLFDEHEGILVVDGDIAPGTLFKDACELDDYLLDIENKSLTHRPDCFGVIGFAREVAAITGHAFKTPDWLKTTSPNFAEGHSDNFQISATIDDPELSSRYQAIVVSGADSKRQSPLKIQTYLARVGVRPINGIVDVTNYLMMLTGQPLHAFDYDKLVAVGGGRADIHVRAAHDGEELTLLDNKTIELSTSDIVIASGSEAIGLAGAMGGANTAIDENTKNIVIESATFNLYNLRSTQMRHGIFSEAITRFTKGQPSELTSPVLANAVSLMSDWSGAEPTSCVAEAYPGKVEPSSIAVNVDKVNGLLGSNLTVSEMADTLNNIEFSVKVDGDNIEVIAPWWRQDIHIFEDVVEEIGRINGFDNISPTLPMREFIATRPNGFDDFRTKLRKILVRAGANEILTYSFIHGDLLNKSNQNTNNSYRIINSISPSLQYYRQSLTPSLLDLVHPNIKQGFDNFALFEVNKTHLKSDGVNDEGVPVENDTVALVFSNKTSDSGAPFYQARKFSDYLISQLGVNLAYRPMEPQSTYPLSAMFECRRSAELVDVANGNVVGAIGEYKKSVTKKFKLPVYTAGFEIYTRKLYDLFKQADYEYKPLSRYPSTERDICFKVKDSVPYQTIIDAMSASREDGNILIDLLPIDIYKAENGEYKNVTIRVTLTSYDHTLNRDEVSKILERLISSVIDKTGATII